MVRLQRLAAGALALALFTNCAYGFDWRNPFRGVFGDREEARPAAPGRQPPPSAASLECPEILVESKTSSLRAPAGADSADVRYQLTLGLMARECSLQGDAIAIKVGVEGAAILGPAGQPGSYFGNLRIAARRQKDGVVLQSKTYRVGATVPTGATRAEFQLIAEPLTVPYINQHAADDYEILVGFESAGAGKPEKPAPHKARRR
ncbi:MAG: hypothetical protein HYZ60_00660 [Methylocystis sp.]|nr:hypothetical protein [Methylocystis sp.]